MQTIEVWAFGPDVERQRTVRSAVRLVAVALGATAVVAGAVLGGVPGGFAGVAVLAALTLATGWWARGVVDAGPQRVVLVERDGVAEEFVVEGPEVYERAVGDDGFELQDHPSGFAHLDLRDAIAVSVYPAVTHSEIASGPAVGFHLVLDTTRADGSRRVAAFDRRIPFRISGERALADAVAEVCGDRWIPEPGDTFGELDRRRLADWQA